MKLVLNVGENRNIPAEGRYIYIESCTGPVRVMVTLDGDVRSIYTLTRRQGLRFDSNIIGIDVLNAHVTANTIEFQNGWAEFLPNNDGQKVNLTGADVAIEVMTPPGNPLEVSGGLTDTELRAAPVDVAGPLTDAQLRAAPVDVQPVIYSTATPLAVITGSGAIPANPGRRFLVIKPLKANAGIGWLGDAVNTGLALEAGDAPVTLETSGAVTITATDPADKFSIMEIEA